MAHLLTGCLLMMKLITLGLIPRITDYEKGVMLDDIMTDMSINMTGIPVGDVDGSHLG
tara:strand:- start:40 stop:213 length:174 start_codon:yes stop_codon:yes gene_type:complete